MMDGADVTVTSRDILFHCDLDADQVVPPSVCAFLVSVYILRYSGKSERGWRHAPAFLAGLQIVTLNTQAEPV